MDNGLIICTPKTPFHGNGDAYILMQIAKKINKKTNTQLKFEGDWLDFFYELSLTKRNSLNFYQAVEILSKFPGLQEREHGRIIYAMKKYL